MVGPPAAAAQDAPTIIFATTTSTYDTGLLDSLLPLFEQKSGIRVKVIAVGTGAALEMARRGDADVVLVHARELEQPYVDRGDLIEARQIMHNDFVLVGPPNDPAGAGACDNIVCAMRAIARTGPFISRGDRSGTHQMELNLWRRAGIDPASVQRRETGQGMGATLDVADQMRGYTLTDRGTFLAHRARPHFRLVFEGDSLLINSYRAYVVNPATHPGVKAAPARALVDFLVSPTAQDAIGRFGVARFGRQLFVPDAAKSPTAPANR